MSRSRWLALVLLLVLGRLVGPAAAEVSLHATLDEPRIHVGDVIDLAVEAEGAQNVPTPTVPIPDGLSLRYVGPESQISIVNGAMTSSVTHHFRVTGVKPGTYQIGPITTAVQGKTIGAGVLSLQVLPAGAAAGGARGAGGAGDPLRLVMETPRTDVYLHERVPLTVKLYVGNVRVSDLHFPTVPGDGFSLEAFPQPAQHQEQTPQGAVQVVEFHTTITPLRTGPLAVGPSTMELGLIGRQRDRSPFGSLFGQEAEPTTLQSAPLALDVLPLPEAGRPDGFSGAVGHFEFEVTAAPLDLAAGDPVTITSAIRGTGTLDLVTAPSVPESDRLRVYPLQPAAPPKNGHPVVGEKRFEQVVIPQRDGADAIPALAFSWFDPEAKAYQTITRGPFPLAVRASAVASRPQIVGEKPTPGPASETPLGRDIVTIKDDPGTLRPLGTRCWTTLGFWLWPPLSIGLWVVAVGWDRRRTRLRGDQRYARFTRAGRQARTAIAAARQTLERGDRAGFYDQAARAVDEYLSAKLDLPPGGVTADVVAARLRGVDPTVADEVREFFGTCERIRFAPAADGDAPATCARAERIVATLERARRLTAPLAALLVVSALAAAWAAPEGVATVFFRGNAAYGEGRFADAATEYGRVLAAGQESGNLYFNLGNAWFRSGDVGRAILAYERARRFMPGDPDLRANLAFAREQSGEPVTVPLWARLGFPLAERFGSERLLVAANGLLAGVMLLLAAGRLWSRLERPAATAARVGALAFAVVATSGVYRLVTIDLPDYAVVVAKDPATVRFEPSANGTPHFDARPGLVLRVLGEREGWFQVARDDGQRGWVPREAVERL